MIKYRTILNEIESFDILRETDKSVFLVGGFKKPEIRELKRSEAQNWFDTWEEAKEFLVANAEKKVEYARKNLERLERELDQIRELKQKTQTKTINHSSYTPDESF